MLGYGVLDKVEGFVWRKRGCALKWYHPYILHCLGSFGVCWKSQEREGDHAVMASWPPEAYHFFIHFLGWIRRKRETWQIPPAIYI